MAALAKDLSKVADLAKGFAVTGPGSPLSGSPKSQSGELGTGSPRLLGGEVETKERADSPKTLSNGTLSLSQHVSTITSHDLQTTQGGITNGVDFLLRDIARLESFLRSGDSQTFEKHRGELLRIISEQRSSAELIRLCVEQEKALVQNDLDFAKLRSGEMRLNLSEFSVSSLISEVRKIIKPSADRKGINLHLDVVYDDTMVKADCARIKQIILNLLTNAIKFTPEKGMVKLSLQKPEISEGRVNLKFAVSDTGVGIDETDLGNIFMPFKQANSSVAANFGGNGIGLCICQKLVGLMGGKLDVKSKKGTGSTFSFNAFCDVAVKSPKPPIVFSKLEARVPQNPTLAGVRILMVDDSAINRRIMERFLGDKQCEKGFTFEIVENGAKAVERCREQGFDVILMDCCMPVMDGFETTRQIRGVESGLQGKRKPAYIIAISATKPELEQVLECGMNGWVIKSDQEELLRVIEDKPSFSLDNVSPIAKPRT